MIQNRCSWVPLDKSDYVAYHDDEWGRPVHDDTLLFENLMLEGAQAGLSWYTILKRRDAYRKAFKGFVPKRVAQMTDVELEKVLAESGVVKHRLKVFSVRKNAHVFLSLQKEFGSFDGYLWGFTPRTKEALSKDLKKRGMTFVGESIVYAFMQAVGLVNDHSPQCDVRI